jgi:TRAP transporter TAXI family solute receptor
MSLSAQRVNRSRLRSALVLCCAVALVSTLLFAPRHARRWVASLSERIFAREAFPVLASARDTGDHARYGLAFKDVLENAGAGTVELVETTGALSSLDLVRRGDADFAFIPAGLGMAMDGIAAVAVLDRAYVHVIVPADAGIRGLRDLQGKRIGVGPQSGSFTPHAARIFDFFEFHDAPIFVNDHNSDLAQAFLDGEIDAAFAVVSLFTPNMESLLDTGWYRLVPLEGVDAAARYLTEFEVVYLPPGLYGPDRTVPSPDAGPFPTLAVDTLLVTRASTPARAVTAVLEGLNAPALLQEARLAPPERLALERGLVPVHPAALKFYARNDPVSVEELETLGYFLVGLAGLGGLGYYAAERVRQRARDRMRRAMAPYFARMAGFGRSIDAATESAVLRDLMDELMTAQREAEAEWLRGRFASEDLALLQAQCSLGRMSALHKMQIILLESACGEMERGTPPPSTHDSFSDARLRDLDSVAVPVWEPMGSPAPPEFVAEAEEVRQHDDPEMPESRRDEAAGAFAPPPADTEDVEEVEQGAEAPVQRRARKANLQKVLRQEAAQDSRAAEDASPDEGPGGPSQLTLF